MFVGCPESKAWDFLPIQKFFPKLLNSYKMLLCALVTWSVLLHILHQTWWFYGSKQNSWTTMSFSDFACVGDIFQASKDQDTGCMVNEAVQSMEAQTSMLLWSRISAMFLWSRTHHKMLPKMFFSLYSCKHLNLLQSHVLKWLL